MKVLKIIECSNCMMWYREKIGHTVVYLGTDKDETVYWSRDDGGYKNIVQCQDAQLIEVSDD